MRMVSAPEKIGDVRWRDLATVEGTVRSLRARPWAENVASVECTLVDGTGGLELCFSGAEMSVGWVSAPEFAPPAVSALITGGWRYSIRCTS